MKNDQLEQFDPTLNDRLLINDDSQSSTLVDRTIDDEQSKVEEEEDDDEVDHLTTCGIGSWRPKWMQVFASPFFFMLNLGLVGVIQGMTGTIFFSSISTLEKRFGFDSKISGIILIADNFADMILNPIMGYIGIRYNRARLIGLGELILAFGSFLTASPYFIYGPGTHLLENQAFFNINSTSTNFEMCNVDRPLEQCEDNQGVTVWPAVIIFILGSWFRGMGYTCYFVVGLPYLDDNIKKEQSPLYISMMHAIRLVGPAFGFMLASFCLSFYEQPFVDPGFGRNDPRFVGAWWLSFIIVGLLLAIVSIPMLFFPYQFKDASIKADDIQVKIKESGGTKGALKRFVSNPLVILFISGNIFRYIGLGGYIMFKSKYIESQFRKSSSSASFITGFTSFLPMAFGIMIGGTAISFFRPRPKTIFIVVFIVEAVSFFTVGSGLLLGCDPINIDGGLNDMNKFSLQSSCNQKCDCSTRVYQPICGNDLKTTYFSPCHAGCSSYNSKTLSFEGCSCSPGSVATKGYCESDVTGCNNLVKYISVVTFGNFISSIARTPNSLIYLRTVDPIDKGFAIGLASSLMDIFAFVPYPLLFGYIADKSCLIWESKCGKTGNCWIYDHDKFRKYLHGGAITFFAIGSLFDFLMIFFSDYVRNFYDDDEDDNKKPKKIEPTIRVNMADESVDLEKSPLNENCSIPQFNYN